MFVIRIKDGQPFEHPISEDNFTAAFPDVDINNLPPEFARFERVQLSSAGVYKVYTGSSYQLIDGVYKDVHTFRDMTSDEILNTQNTVKDNWNIAPNWSSWTFNEETCEFDPPVAYPTDGNQYIWNEETLSWILEE